MKILVLLAALATSLAAAHKIPIRDGNQVFGTTTVYVGAYKWSQLNEPMRVYNNASTTVTTRYDFNSVTCVAGTDICTAVCPRSFACESGTGHNLPNGTEVVFGTSGTLPAPLKSFSQDKKKRYYIRDTTTTTFKLAATSGGAAIDITDAGSGTHQMSFAGYTHAFVLEGGYSKDFTCVAATNICTSTAHGYADDATVYMTSTGTLPGGLTLRYGLGWGKHCIMLIDANTFYLKRPSMGTDGAWATCSSTTDTAIDITDAGTGTHSFFNGAGNLWIWSISGYPAGTTFTFHRQAENQTAALFGSSIKPQFNYSDDQIGIYAKVPAVTAAGTYPITITTSESSSVLTNSQTSGFDLIAKTITPISKVGPTAASYTAIPGLAWWEDMLTDNDDGGGTDDGTHSRPHPRCPNPSAPSFSLDFPTAQGQEIWFYEGAASYYEMRNYLNDTVWNNCGNYIVDVSKNYVLNPPDPVTNPDGAHAGYYYCYSRGAARAFAHTGNGQYRALLKKIADTTKSHSYTVGSLYDKRIREQTFSYARLKHYSRVSGIPSYHEQDYISSLVGILDELANGNDLFTFHQPFMVGVLMKELTEYYREHNDERIPHVIKQYVDKFYTDWYDSTSKRMYYNPEPLGARCYDSCGLRTGSILNGLIAPAFAFIWRLNGDNTYRDQADELFLYQSGPTLNNGPYQAKNWSEMNYWIWDYIYWRQGKLRAY